MDRSEDDAAAGSGASAALPVYVNPRAGRAGHRVRDELLAALRAHAVPARLLPVRPTGVRALAAEHAAAGTALLGVAGGDGSMRAAAAALAGSNTALAPFPTGTLNHFARRHGLDTLDAAAAAVARGDTHVVPLGLVGDEIFLNTATFGYYAELVRRRERRRRWLSRWPAAAVAAFELAVRAPTIDVELELEGESIRRSTPLVWIGLGWGSLPRVHEASERRRRPDLEIAILRAGTWRAHAAFLLRMIPRLFRSDRPIDDAALELYHARSLVVRAPDYLDVTLDGELHGLRAPVSVAVRDEALRIVQGPASGF